MYGEHASSYDEAIADNIYNAHIDRPTLQSMLDDISGKHVLDLGCGSGPYTQYLFEKGAAKVTAVDTSPAMLEILKQRVQNSALLNAYQQDLSLGLPQESNASYDFAICPLTLHYLHDIESFFKEVSRVLKPSGYLVFSTHHPWLDFEDSPTGDYYATELIHQSWDTIGVPVEVSFYRRSLTDISQSLLHAGFHIALIKEGEVAESVKDKDLERYLQLKKQPIFLFIKAIKF
ncbi:SAM-dependent methyltransferase [Photobacterium aquae]|uniref:SAM-dependent methyltransferase n=2 Tax=Photobacterium aquae TaxID=1195763 RepID=A0A0J1GUA1_9GAMM|nr:SAM-dependent methyltransferase [Photobacterium aquae]